MDERKDLRSDTSTADIPDITEICPNCGHRGEWRKCKLLCTNARCGTHIILACVD